MTSLSMFASMLELVHTRRMDSVMNFYIVVLVLEIKRMQVVDFAVSDLLDRVDLPALSFPFEGYIDVMGWVWRDDEEGADSSSSDVSRYEGLQDRCSTRKIVKSCCKTEEVEPGKFIRKCEKTEEILRDCIGKPVEVVQSSKEYAEDDVTEQVLKGSSPLGSSDHAVFDFPGLHSDIDAIGRSFMGNIDRFFQAAEEMKKGFFGVFEDPPYADRDLPSSSRRRGIPVEDPRPKEYSLSAGERDSSLDLSGMAKDV